MYGLTKEQEETIGVLLIANALVWFLILVYGVPL